jgi:hypothetical protein
MAGVTGYRPVPRERKNSIVICEVPDINPDNNQLQYCEINPSCVFKQETHGVITDQITIVVRRGMNESDIATDYGPTK